MLKIVKDITGIKTMWEEHPPWKRPRRLEKRNKYNQIEFLEMKNVVTDIENSVNRLNSRFDPAEDRIHRLEDGCN